MLNLSQHYKRQTLLVVLLSPEYHSKMANLWFVLFGSRMNSEGPFIVWSIEAPIVNPTITHVTALAAFDLFISNVLVKGLEGVRLHKRPSNYFCGKRHIYGLIRNVPPTHYGILHNFFHKCHKVSYLWANTHENQERRVILKSWPINEKNCLKNTAGQYIILSQIITEVLIKSF